MADSELEIFRLKARVLRDARQHLWADLIIVVKGEHNVGPTGARQSGGSQIAA